MTRKILLIAGVAGLALTAPVSAGQGGRGGDKPSKAEARQDHAQRPQRQEPQRQAQRAERPQRAQRAERPQRIERQAERPQRVERPRQVERQAQRAERPQRIERQQQRVERKAQRVERPQHQRVERQRVERPARVERQAQRVERPRQVERQQQQRIERQAQRVERGADRRVTQQIFESRADNRRTASTARIDGRSYRPAASLNAGREMRPMKPFKAKFGNRGPVSIGERVDRNRTLSAVPAFYASRYVDTPRDYYRYDDDGGYVYRIGRNDGAVRSLIPLFGGYGVGDPWPSTYYSSYVPLGYRDTYYDTPDYYYRNDGYGIYQVDSSTQLITALVALLTGQSYGIGQTLPASYGVYNVPLQYRSSYYDTDDRSYRYGDGFIYQMDPYSRRVAARYPIYGDDYYVGDPWPAAYPDYNVPYGYRSTYYDTPQYQYRYANDGIYQVDPTNQVILSLAALLSGDQFAVGQQLPNGYGAYNVPVDYRDRYADSDDQWYRYANGNVYQVDPRSGLIEEAYPIYT